MSDSQILPGGAPPHGDDITFTAAGNIPPGTPLNVQSDATVLPTDGVTGGGSLAKVDAVAVATTQGSAGSRMFGRPAGLLTLTADQWDAVIEGGGVLVPGDKYWVSINDIGKIVTPEPTGGFHQPIGTATTTLGLLINLELSTDHS